MTGHTAMSIDVYAELGGTLDAPGHARELVRDALGNDHPCASDAALIVSELVGNAVTHSRSGQPGGTLFLAIETTTCSSDVRVQVRDAGSTRIPAIRAADLDGEHGRGLAIVTALAAEWGSQPTEAGQATWARIASPQPLASQPGDPDREAG